MPVEAYQAASWSAERAAAPRTGVPTAAGVAGAGACATAWDPGSADYIVGTSAGSVIGSLVSTGVPPWFMVAHSAGESFEGLR